ncbi:uncharacterized protein UTRI_05334_B [Ustilago trichophora]|uniref:Uncharacterized protein n=1 Tax=Ustilago trichophora TaxID=86804 RepID=A0A5C3EKH9_9BASI|nr:uncharacterized protein UTRI_05334_B [Ustilago trichophora]
MDPAFSLADELADLHHPSFHNTNQLHFHPHHAEYAAGTSLADQYQAFGLDAELQGLHLHGNDLASELGGDGGGGSLADELDPSYSGDARGGSLGDELLQHIEKEEDDRVAYMSRNGSASDAFLSDASSPTSSSRHATLSRQSNLLNPSSPSRSSISTPTTTTSIPGDATSSTTTTTISSTLASLAQTAELDQTFSATQTFLSHLSSLSTRNTAGAVDATTATATTTTTTTGETGEEDTSRLEYAAANYLKLVSQSTAEREAQLRELRELDRKFARSLAENNSSGGVFGLSSSKSGHLYGGELHNFSPVSSSLTLPEVEEDEEESDFSTHLASSPTRSLARRHRSTTSLASDTTITDMPPSSHPLDTPLIDNTLFAPFYTSTSTLLTSLTSLHEHTQITKSTTADAARKLKTLKGLIQQWRAEMESVETSELWIASHGESEQEKEKMGVWLGEQVDWCQRRIEQVEVRARLLLTPVSLSS